MKFAINRIYVFKALALLLFVFTFINSNTAASYHFSTSEGDDSHTSIKARNPDTPWKSIDKLNQIMNSLSPGDSVLFKRGDVFYGSIKVTKSGNATLPIVFAAYGEGPKPVITSLVKLEGWTSKGKGLYESNMTLSYEGQINIVTIDGIPHALGRFPNFDDEKKGYITIESTENSNTIYSSELESSIDWTGGEVVIRKNPWIIDRHPIIKSARFQINYFNSPTMNHSDYSALPGYGFFIQNHISTLDVFGEWVFNENTKKLSVFFGNQNPEDFRVEVSDLSNLINFNRGIGHITFTDLDLQGANQSAFNIRSVEKVRIIETNISLTGEFAIIGDMAHDLEVAYCKINQSLNNGIFIGNSTMNVKIINNEIRNTFMFNGMGKTSDLNGLAIYTPSTCDNGLIENNQIYDTGYIPINFGGNNTVVKNNLINNFCIHKSDGGAIYTWEGPSNKSLTNRIIEGNIILNGNGYTEGTLNSGSLKNPQIDGIYMDDNTSGVLIKNNSVANVSGKGVNIHNARNINLEQNLFYNNSEHIFFIDDNLGDPISNLKVNNNIFFSIHPDQYFIKKLSSKGTSFNGMAQFDNNYFMNPFGNKYGIVLEEIISGKTIRQILDLESWGNDPGFYFNPHKLNYLKKAEFVGANLFPNQGFDQNIESIFCLGCSASRKTGGGFDGGYLNILANKGDRIGLGVNGLASKKHYILSFTGKANKNTGLKLIIEKGAHPWYQMNRPIAIELLEDKTTYEVIYFSEFNEDKVNLLLYSTADNLNFSIDNVKFKEANIEFYDPEEVLLFEYNHSNNTKKFPLSGTYIDAKNNSFSGSVDIAPFSAIALIKVSDEGEPELPTISIIHPSEATELNLGEKLKMEFEANSTNSTIEKVELYLNEILIQTLDTLPYEFEHLFDKEGEFILKAKAIDKNGLAAYSEGIRIQVYKAATAPIISWISPSDNDFFFAEDTIKLSVLSENSEQNILKIDFLINNNVVGSVINEPYQITVNNLPIGTHEILAKAINDAGLEGQTEVISITVLEQENKLLTPPILLEPITASKDLSDSITFKWSKPEHAETYRLQIAKDQEFEKIQYDFYNIPTTFFFFNKNLDAGTTYYWRVNASNKSTNSNFSESSKFETLSLPEIPKLINPTNGEKDLGSALMLEWEVALGAKSYRVQVSKSKDFSENIVDLSNIVKAFLNIENLEAGQTYFWRLRSSNKAGNSGYSEVWEFSTKNPISTPSAPQLVSPTVSSIVKAEDINFEWTSVNLAEKYQIQISKYSNFNQAIVYDNNQVSTTSLSNIDLEPGEIYFWRVRAINAAGPGPYSSIWSFRTESLFPLSNPELLSPGKGAKIDSSMVKFTWNPVEEAEFYQLSISKDSTFKENRIRIDQIINNQWMLNGFEIGGTFYWQVSANGKRPSSQSEVWSFSIEEIKETDFTNESTAILNIYPNPFKNVLNLEFSKAIKGEIGISIFDSKGVVLYYSQINHPGENIILEIPQRLPNGIYFIKIQGTGFLDNKIIIRN